MARDLQLRSHDEKLEATGSNGMAATSQPLATLVAIDVLNMGGSAVDAAIAANAMLGLVEPTGCGIGGDLFALVWDPSARKLHGLNASGRAPQALDTQELGHSLENSREIPIAGPHCVTVPGCVDGWFELHERFGRLEMPQILAPAIQACNCGFQVTRVIAEEWARDVERIQNSGAFLTEPSAFTLTYAPAGRAPEAGARFTNPDLARTLGLISDEGKTAFYHGRTAQAIASAVSDRGGYLRAEDLASHYSEWVEPISRSYRGFDIFELPPNNQGLTVLQMLGLLEELDISSNGFGSANALHTMIEMKKLAFEDRARFISDPAFNGWSSERFLSEKRLADQRKRFVQEEAIPVSRAFLAPAENGDTCYLTTADRDGMMVSLMQSNFIKFGSGIVPEGLGFCLQNRGALFSLRPDHANVIAPGKRPFHTIIPAFAIRRGRPVLSFGVMGGAMQPQGQVQILTSLIDFGMSLQEAGDAPRWRHVGSSRPTGIEFDGTGAVLYDSGFAEKELESLRQRGHVLENRSGAHYFGGYQAIGIDAESGDYVGASDTRKDGMAIGL